MSHRKFEAPRHGSLAFLPKKRCTHGRGKLKAFPKDDPKMPVHLTAFIGFKVGMTHVVREVDRPGSKMHKKEIVEPVTIIETPPMVAIGLVGYKETPHGHKPVTTAWATHMSSGALRRFHRRYAGTSKTAFRSYFKNENSQKEFEERVEEIAKHSDAVRVILHTTRGSSSSSQLKAHVVEVQLNGGQSVRDKVNWAVSNIESQIEIQSVFQEDEMIDTIGITKGKGFEGVTTRWGTTKLPRKTNKGIRKVACIGAWHPNRVFYSVARAGQNGYHHRTELNKKIYRISDGSEVNSGSTKFDLTTKTINPMGGFPGYGEIKKSFVMIKGQCLGPRKRAITLRKSLIIHTKRSALEKTKLKFIDTSSKLGHGRFQTREEKRDTIGKLKKDRLNEQYEQLDLE